LEYEEPEEEIVQSKEKEEEEEEPSAQQESAEEPSPPVEESAEEPSQPGETVVPVEESISPQSVDVGDQMSTVVVMHDGGLRVTFKSPADATVTTGPEG
jgi:hypothetical protein